MFQNSEFIISAVRQEQFPNVNNFPEFVFLGRSNVGKSSLINGLCQRKLLAKVSSKPGKTITINFYLIDKSIYFVDVPGYGFAQRSQTQKQEFGGYIEDYLRKNQNLKCAFLLVDTKVGPTKDDLLMYEFLKYNKVNTVIVATKADKIGKTLILKALKAIKSKISDAKIILTSTVTKQGLDELQNFILNY